MVGMVGEIKEGKNIGTANEQNIMQMYADGVKLSSIYTVSQKHASVVVVIILANVDRLLPRDAMHKRGLRRHAVFVRPCVCLSVTFVDCVKTNKHIFRFFSPSSSYTPF